MKTKLLIVLLALVIPSAFIEGYNLGNEIELPPPKVYVFHRVKEVPVIKEVEKIVYKTLYVNKFIEVEKVITEQVEATEEELTRVFEALRYGRWSHQQFLNMPWIQNNWTGDTEFNQLWVENYDLFRELIERAYCIE